MNAPRTLLVVNPQRRLRLVGHVVGVNRKISFIPDVRVPSVALLIADKATYRFARSQLGPSLRVFVRLSCLEVRGAARSPAFRALVGLHLFGWDNILLRARHFAVE